MLRARRRGVGDLFPGESSPAGVAGPLKSGLSAALVGAQVTFWGVDASK